MNDDLSICSQILLPFLADDEVLNECNSKHTATALVQFLQMVSSMEDDANVFQSILESAKVTDTMNLAQYRNSVMNLVVDKQLTSLKQYKKQFNSEQLIYVYYALSKQILARTLDPENSKEVKFIYQMTLTLHRYILLYVTKKSTPIQTSIKDTTKNLIRINDILLNVLGNKHLVPHLYDWLFSGHETLNSIDFYLHIVRMIVNHPNTFVLYGGGKNSDHKYLKIERGSESFQIDFSGRVSNAGAKKKKSDHTQNKDISGIESAANPSDQAYNINYSGFFKDAKKHIETIIEAKPGKSENSKSGNGGNSYERHPTPPEPFEVFNESIIPALFNDIDYADQAFYPKESSRFPHTIKFLEDVESLSEEKKKPPTLRQQMKHCKAFSAAVTKYRLLLTTDYDTPTLSQLSFFLQTLLEKPFTKNKVDSTLYSEQDIQRIMLVACIVTGIEYDRLIQILERSSNSRNRVEIIKEKYLHLQLDESLQVQDDLNENLFHKTERNITYKLPYILDLLLDDVIKHFNQYHFLKNANQKEFIESYIQDMAVKIHFKPKDLWRLSLTYRREELTSDVNAMYAMGKFQQNDKPRMHYHTTPKRSVIHSKWLEKYSEILGTESLLATAMGLNPYQPKPVSKETGTELTGSKKYIKDESLTLFFKEISSLYFKTNDPYIKHNLLSIHLRYAMSVLLGTREYNGSDHFSKISYSIGVMITSEKAQTELSGTRIIPMCKTIVDMIRNYIHYCQLHFKITPLQPFLFRSISKTKDWKPYPSEITFKASMKEFTSDMLIASMYDNISTFIRDVPLNIGRYIASNHFEKMGLNYHYLEAYLGHYFAGAEQHGKFSSMDTQEYIRSIANMTESFAHRYGIRKLINV
ncbi:hypothetical protein Sulku_2800 (plasmid) [Sulfuricurvum kujiense DSM 16994]|uniref:Uncharacterized protein n=1 Tax=Sulfuricurvum kujiense (strain ATCC BAA-921 / DSM 16994 / JCM 11577 / YK-1) TaxID=709032 RepID=E4U432_SULKY|nr:hypothetical protein [Sulfuricurvum kujiense]ADR35448.1 hypothetical protein Sulku_2800 [Sulfuricurvum kujiense DSM 16994]